MKKMLIYTKDKEYLDLYYPELEELFGNYLEITGKSYLQGAQSEKELELSVDPEDKADIVVTTSPYSMAYARPYLKENTKIINLKFRFAEEKIQELRKYPPGTNVLVYCKYLYDSQLTADALYEENLNNLNLYIDYLGNKNLIGRKIDIVVVNQDSSHLPKKIKNVFFTGKEKISLSTLLDIMIFADIYNEELEQKILIYSNAFAHKDYISYFLGESTTLKMQLQTISNYLDQGMLILDTQRNILNCNKIFIKMFSLPSDILGKSLYDFDKFSVFMENMLKQGDFADTYFEYDSQRYLFTKKSIRSGTYTSSTKIFLAKNITEIMNLENKMQKQMAKKGHFAKHKFSDLLGKSEIFTECKSKAEKIALIDKPTLLIGESGTGKELFAQSIHNASSRKNYPFVAVNCAAIPEDLLESELFGYVEGAFTGAKKGGKIGLFQLAQKGTLFLDEIGEIPLSTQVKLLRVLEEKEIMKIGSDEITKIDVRIITATNKDLNQSVKEGTFRLDLYFRLNTLMLRIPPLRSRKEDIPCLVSRFLSLEQCNHIKVSPSVYNFFYQQQWEGNIRQLRNTIEYSAHIAKEQIELCHLPDYFENPQQSIYNEINNEMHEQSIEVDLQINNSIEFELFEKIGFESLEEAEIAKQILLLLKEKHIGRRQLLLQLRQSDYQISEYKLRKITANLKKSGYILFGAGREGCRLSNYGIIFIKKNNM